MPVCTEVLGCTRKCHGGCKNSQEFGFLPAFLGNTTATLGVI